MRILYFACRLRSLRRKGAGVAREAVRIEDEPDGEGPSGVGARAIGRSPDAALWAVPTPQDESAVTPAPGTAGRAGVTDGERADLDRTGHSGLPDPADTARALALCVVEILSGARDVDSIARWVTDEVHRHLQQRAALTARNRSALRRPQTRPALRADRVVTCTPAAGVVEATVVVHGQSHARAVAIRLEVRNGRWRATTVGVL